jgi:dihydrofolate reductase
MASEIILIAAMARNRVIGRNNTIPWDIPGEQTRFKHTTMGYPLIMGRRTWLSLGKPLPGRRNVVLTRSGDFTAPGAWVVHSMDEALALCKGAERVFVIGGEAIFRLAMPLAETLILTVLERDVEGDTCFPPFSCPPFVKVVTTRITHPEPYSIITYRRQVTP